MKRFNQVITASIFTLLFIFSVNSHASNYVVDAKKNIANGEYKTAIIQLKNYLKESPDDAQARYLLGMSYQKSGNLAGASKEFEKAYKTNKNDHKIQLAYAKILKLKNKEQAKNILLQNYEDNSDESQRLVILAEIALSENKLADATELLKRAEELNNTAEVQLAFVTLAIVEKDGAGADKRLEEILKKDNKNKTALFLKAMRFSNKNELQKSLDIFDQLYKEYPNDLRFLLERAGVKYKKKDYEGVEQDLSVILNKNKNFPQANSLMSLSKLQQKDYKSAREYTQKVLNILPDHSLSLFVSGVSEFALGNLNQAEKALNQVLFKFPDNLEAQSILSSLYIAKKEGEQALLILESIDKDTIEKNAKLLLNLGTAYLLIGEHEKAMLALNQAKKIEPDNKLVNERLVVGYFKSKDMKNAIASLESIAADKKNMQAQYLLVMTYIQNKEFDKAKETIKRLKIQSPNDPNLHNFEAALHLINKNIELAYLSYQQAIKLDANYIPAYLGIIRIHMDKNEYDIADNLFEKILSTNNKYIKAWLGRAAIAEKKGEAEKVEFFITEGLNHSKGEVKSELIALTQLAKWYNRQGQKEKVLELGREIVQRYPNNATAQFFQVKALLLNGKSQSAEMALEKLLYNDSENRTYQLLLVRLMVEKKDNQRAFHLLDNILKSNSNDRQAMLLKGKLLALEGQNKKAIETSRLYQQVFPEGSAGFQLEADVLLAEKKYEKALVKYQIAFKKTASDQLLLKIVSLLIKQKKTDEAIEFLTDVITGDNANIIARYRLAVLLQKQQKNELAIEQYKALISLEPSNVLALNNLAWMLSEKGDGDALKLGKKAYESAPDSPAILDTYGYILLKENHLEEGTKLLQKAVELAPKAYDIHYHLAKAYFLAGKTQKAKNVLSLVLNEDANFSEKENAKKLFNQLQ